MATTSASGTRTDAPAAQATASARAWSPADSRLWVSGSLFVLAVLVYSWIDNGRPTDLDYFVPLAEAVLQGRLDVAEHPSWLNELVPFGGRWYVVYPPMPGIVLLPFVAVFGADVDQGFISILLGGATVAVASLVLHGFGLRRWTWVLFSALFAFGTIFWYSAQAGSSWHIAHVVALLFLFLAILAAQQDRSPFLVGALFGAAALARLPMLLGFPFFLAWVAYRASRPPAATTDPRQVERRGFGVLGAPVERIDLGRLDRVAFVRSAWLLGAGTGIFVLAYLAYNELRFGSPFQTGYDLIPGLLQEYQYRFGFFSVHNIPRNLYAMLLTPPRQFDGFPWIQPALLGGMSILLTTPPLVWAIRKRTFDWFAVGAWVAILLILVPVLTHADPGGAQFGYRYALDYTPLLFLLAVHGMATPSGRVVITLERGLAIGLAFLVNLWGMVAIHLEWLA